MLARIHAMNRIYVNHGELTCSDHDWVALDVLGEHPGGVKDQITRAMAKVNEACTVHRVTEALVK